MKSLVGVEDIQVKVLKSLEKIKVERECCVCPYFYWCITNDTRGFFPLHIGLRKWVLYCGKCNRVWFTRLVDREVGAVDLATIHSRMRITRELHSWCDVLTEAGQNNSTWLGRCPQCSWRNGDTTEGYPIVRAREMLSGSCVSRVIGRIKYEQHGRKRLR